MRILWFIFVQLFTTKNPACAGLYTMVFCYLMLVHTKAMPLYLLGGSSNNMNGCNSLPIYYAAIIGTFY
jgi:hypothetical protein